MIKDILDRDPPCRQISCLRTDLGPGVRLFHKTPERPHGLM